MRPTPRSRSRGMASLFFAAVILPMLFFLFTISIDLVAYYRLTKNIQHAADQAALYAYRYLPFQEAARQAAREFLSRESALLPHTEIRVTPDTVSLSIEGTSPLFFAKFFAPDAGLPVSAHASARGQPSDIYLAIDTSAYLAPALRAEPWGEEEAWPAASFFATQHTVYDDQGAVPPRNATQQCFNPVLIPIKKAAIAAFEYTAGFQLNTVGVGLFPGRSDVDDLRPVLPSSAVIPPIETPFGIEPGGGHARFNLLRGGTIGRELLCAAAAQEELHFHPYRFPGRNAVIPALWEPESGAPTSRFLPNSWDFDPEYQDYLTAQEVIWSAMAQPEYPITERVIGAVWSRLSAVDSFPDRRTAQVLTRKAAIIISGDVPWTARMVGQSSGGEITERYRYPHPVVGAELESRLHSILEHARAYPKTLLPFDLQLIIIRHPRSSPTLMAEAASLEQLLTSAIDPEMRDHFRVSVMVAQHPEDLVHTLSGLFILRGRAAVLAK